VVPSGSSSVRMHNVVPEKISLQLHAIIKHVLVLLWDVCARSLMWLTNVYMANRAVVSLSLSVCLTYLQLLS